MRHHLVVPLLVVLLFLAGVSSQLAFAQSTPSFLVSPPHPDAELQIGLRRPGFDLKTGSEGPASDGEAELRNSVQKDAGGLPDQVVSSWNEQVLEWDELTRCIRGSETGNAIERWLDCLESLEKNPAPDSSALKPLETVEKQHLKDSAESTSSDAEVIGSLQLTEDTMGAFDPLAGVTVKGRKRGSSEESSEGVEGIGSARIQDSTARLAQEPLAYESQRLKSATVSDDQVSGTTSEAWKADASSDAKTGHGDEAKGPLPSSASEMSENVDRPQISLEDDSEAGEGVTPRAKDVRRSGSKLETDTTSVTDDSRPLQSSVHNEDAGYALNSSGRTKRSQILMDALKLAACLGAAVTILWKKKDWLLASGKEKQSFLSEQAEEYPCASASGFSMTGRASSNTDMAYPNVKAGSLSTPLGMAIATVMAEALEQDHNQRAPRTADELSKLLEAAMTESLFPVMGSECPGFVEQFKQSFRSTYRLLGTVRNASGRTPARPSLPNFSRDFPTRRSEGQSRRHYRLADDEEDDSSSLTSFSRGAYVDPVFESDIGRGGPDSETDLTEPFSKLNLSVKRPDNVAKGRHAGTVPLGYPKSGPYDGKYSSLIDQEVNGELGDVSSSRDASEGLSEEGTKQNCGGSQVPQNGTRNGWGRGGLEQLANVWGVEDVASQSASQQTGRHQIGSSLESGDKDLALQPFGIPQPGQLVAASEYNLSHYGGGTHYQQQKIMLMQQEMHLRQMELTYKFRDLHLKEANLHLASETNSLMKENVDLSRNKIDFKEAEFQDRKLTAAYTDFARRCADEMVAGLCVMLCALFFGAWKYSYERLANVVSVCQPTLYEPSNSYVPGFNKIVNSLNLVTSQIHMFVCEVTVASRMFLGLGIISFVAASLLRKSVSSSSQAMPATILIVVLGGICGLAGKFAVDSMGGSGYHWLLMWETFCLLHTYATCFTSTLYRLLHGAPLSATGKRHRQPYFIKPGLRRLWFHVTAVLVLPVLAGLLPFAHVREIVHVLGSNLWNLTYSPMESYLRKHYQFSFL